MPPRRVTNPPQVENLPHIGHVTSLSQYRCSVAGKVCGIRLVTRSRVALGLGGSTQMRPGGLLGYPLSVRRGLTTTKQHLPSPYFDSGRMPPALPPALRQTPREIVQRAVALDHANYTRIREFTYRQRQWERQYDSSGQPKQTTIRTWEISFLEGSPYRRLVARNDQPLSAEERKFEEDRLRYTAEQRRKEPKAEREKRVAEWERRQQKQREPVLEVPTPSTSSWPARKPWTARRPTSSTPRLSRGTSRGRRPGPICPR